MTQPPPYIYRSDQVDVTESLDCNPDLNYALANMCSDNNQVPCRLVRQEPVLPHTYKREADALSNDTLNKVRRIHVNEPPSAEMEQVQNIVGQTSTIVAEAMATLELGNSRNDVGNFMLPPSLADAMRRN